MWILRLEGQREKFFPLQIFLAPFLKAHMFKLGEPE